MKVKCPHCQVKTDVKMIQKSVPQGIHIQRECPSCQKWFRLKALQNKLKIAGILLLLVTSLSNFVITDSEVKILLSAIGFVGIFIAFVVTFFGQQEKILPPSQ